MGIVAETLQQYLDQGFTLYLDCPRCGRRPTTLARLCAMGYGNEPLPDFHPTCAKCRERLQKIVEPPRETGGRPGFLL
jgi:hypothetical protein